MQRLPTAVERLLEGVESGDWEGMEQHFTPDALYDGSMPQWRVQYRGPDRIVQKLREEWAGRYAWRIVERHVTQDDDSVVVAFEAMGVEPGGGSQAKGVAWCRVANIFRLRDGRIAEHRSFSCGVWDEAIVRHVEQSAPVVERPAAAVASEVR